MPEFFPNLIESNMREAASFGLVNPSLVRMFRKPLARELFDYQRCFSAMKIEGALKIAMVSNRMKSRIYPDMLRQFTAEEITQLATRQAREEVAREDSKLLNRAETA